MHIESDVIDKIGIVPALAKRQAALCAACRFRPQTLVLLDGSLYAPLICKIKNNHQGGRKSACDRPSSIAAKITRDALMTELDLKYPGYGLRSIRAMERPLITEAISKLGLSPIHRKTFTKKIQNPTVRG